MKKLFISKQTFIDKHSVNTLLIACSDFRFRKAFDQFLSKMKKKEFDRIVVPGGHLAFFSKQAGGFDFSKGAISWAKLLVEKHHIQEIFIVGHEQCAAYSSSPKYKGLNFDQLKEKQLLNLALAKKLFAKNFPKSKISLFFASFDEKRNVVFCKV